jgi:integrase
MTLTEAYHECLLTVWKGTGGEDAAMGNSQSAINFFGGASSLESITNARIKQYVKSLKSAGKAPATINRKLSALSSILRVAYENGDLAKFPHFHGWQQEPGGRLRWLSEEEETKLVNFFIDHGMMDHLNAMAVLIDTGLRPSELWRVELAHITGNVLMVAKTKTGRPRCVPLTRRALLILTSRGARPFPRDNQWMERGWDKAKRALGLAADKEFLVYTLRHTCASRLLQRGTPLATLSQWLGHASLKTTMRYAHLSVSNLQQAMQVLEPINPYSTCEKNQRELT